MFNSSTTAFTAFTKQTGSYMSEADETLLQRSIVGSRLFKVRTPLFDRTQLKDQPPSALPLLLFGSIQKSALAPSTQYSLISEIVPPGFAGGVITDRACWFQGAGFQEGSGSLIWSLAVGDGYAYKQGNIQYSIGPDFGTSLVGEGGLMLQPNQLIRFILTTGSDLSSLDDAGTVLVRLRGWYLPAQAVSRKRVR
jgi:hypothetical protein